MRLIVLCWLLSLNAWAGFATVEKVSGEVFVGKKKAKSGLEIPEKSKIAVGKNAYIKIRIKADQTTVLLGPNTKMTINSQLKANPISVQSGMLRWISKKKDLTFKGVQTKNASLGVRGTDFIVIRNALLGETEIVCLGGKVMFENKSHRKDQSLIKKGQWGGLGGRFGSRIGTVLDLPEEVINHFKSILN